MSINKRKRVYNMSAHTNTRTYITQEKTTNCNPSNKNIRLDSFFGGVRCCHILFLFVRARHVFFVCVCVPHLILLSVIFLVKCVDIFFPLSLFWLCYNVSVVRLSIQSFLEIRFTNFYYTLMNWEPWLGGAVVVVVKNEADARNLLCSLRITTYNSPFPLTIKE